MNHVGGNEPFWLSSPISVALNQIDSNLDELFMIDDVYYMQAHYETIMSAKDDDVLRLNNLLSAGQSITGAAKIVNASCSIAQRLKRKNHQSNYSQGDLNLTKSVLGENAATLQVASGSMSHKFQLRVRHA